MANDNKEKDAKLKALQMTLDKLDKTYGKGAVMKMGDVAHVDVEAISSGSLRFGSWPWALVDTQEGELLKSTDQNLRVKQRLTIHAIAEAQKAGGIAAFIDAEHAFDQVLCGKPRCGY